MREDTKKFLRELLSGGYRASAIGMALVFAIFIGFFLGWMIDNYMGWDYLGKFIGTLMGIIAGFRNVYIMGQRYKQ